MFANRSPFTVVETGTSELAVLHRETEWVDEVQTCPGIRTQAYDIARVRGDLGLEQNHVEHRQNQARER